MKNYTDQELDFINNIHNIDLLDTLRHNKLSFDFTVNYILNEKYQETRKEKNITVETVINYQPHLYELFMEVLKKNEDNLD